MKDGPLNKAVIFAPIPGQTHLLSWLKTFQPKVVPFLYHSHLDSKAHTELLEKFALAITPSILLLTLALGGTGLNLTAAIHIVIIQKFWNLNEQRQAVVYIHLLGQMRKPTWWMLPYMKGVNDRVQELHEMRGKCEAPIIHGLIGTGLSYTDLLDAQNTRIKEENERKAANGDMIVVNSNSGS